MRSRRQFLLSESIFTAASAKCAGLFAAVLLFAAMVNTICFAQSTSPTDDADRVGITGHYRIGHWTAVRVDRGNEGEFTIETMDGDGVRVAYEHPKSSSSAFGYVVPGIEAAPLVVRAGEETEFSGRFPELGSPSRGPSAIPIDMAWIVCLGDPLGVDEIGANELLRRDAQIAVSKPTDATTLPDSAMGYDGVDLIMINAAGRELLSGLAPAQTKAIVDAVHDGTKLFLTLGESGPKLIESAPWLLDLLPLKKDDVTTSQLNPAAVETYTTTQTPLSEFVGIRLPKGVGRIILTGRTTRRVSIPFAAEYVSGFGQITVLAADLESDVFAQWPDRMNLLKRLTGTVLDLKKGNEQTKSRLTAYDDLAGQTRATLDQFSVKRSFGFSVLSLVLMALIALVGPLDYLVVNRVLGRPLLGWFTFPIVVVGISAVLAMQAKPSGQSLGQTSSAKVSASNDTDESTPDVTTELGLVKCNRMEFIDIDAVSKAGNGFAWSFIYSHPANLFDVNVTPTAQLAESAEIDQISTAPYGSPGESFGGVQIAGQDARLPSYQVTKTEDDDSALAVVRNLALAPRSSKSLATRLRFQPRLAREITVTQRPGSDTLDGRFVNPLDVDLLDGMLVYGNWVYFFPTRLVAGGEIDSLNELRQKNFRWQLSRQQLLEKNAVERETWDASDFGMPDRVAEMLMFHGAVGGTRYTGLKHQPLSFLDLSELLDSDRCILVGRVRDPLLNVQLNRPGSSNLSAPSGETLTWLRVVLPVEPGK